MKSKTHSGAKKRVKITGGGKLMFAKACKKHLLSSKSKRQRKISRLGIDAPKGSVNSIVKLLNIAK